ncbi:hypothetical protein ACTXIZ_12785 [Psychrobacter celer]|uniref:hypothetical protein n=1 Tax=Psychrobacter celer TaxID=306572 RepID=UPI003FCF5992
MARKKDKLWLPFYNALSSFYELLLDDERKIDYPIYQSKAYYDDPPFADKHYRAVIYVLDTDVLREPLEHVAKAFYASHKAFYENEKGYDADVIPKLPIYVPRIVDGEKIVKMQVHENKAHSSTNYKKDEMIPVISVLKSKLTKIMDIDFDDKNADRTAKITYQEALDSAVEALRDNDYSVSVEHNEDTPYLIVNIDTARLCDVYDCDSIQQRIFTGRQIRANFFTQNNEGKLERSTLKSVGVLITDRRFSIVDSHQRSMRTDAIYTTGHPDEIVLEAISPELRSGRLYKKYKAK